MTFSEKALEIARSKLGMHEVGGPNQGPIVEWAMRPWSKAAVGAWAEWCAAFVCTCFLEAGFPQIKKIASTNCNTLWKSCEKAGYAWQNTPSPSPKPIQPGDLIFFGSLKKLVHVGLVDTVDMAAGTLITLEGNAGNAVRHETYRLNHSKIFGFARLP